MIVYTPNNFSWKGVYLRIKILTTLPISSQKQLQVENGRLQIFIYTFKLLSPTTQFLGRHFLLTGQASGHPLLYSREVDTTYQHAWWSSLFLCVS